MEKIPTLTDKIGTEGNLETLAAMKASCLLRHEKLTEDEFAAFARRKVELMRERSL